MAPSEAPILLYRWLLYACLQQASPPGTLGNGNTLSMPEALHWALTLQRQVVAARLDIDESAVDTLAAKIWPNPEFSYSVNNLVLGPGNDQERDLRPRFAEQTIQSFGVSQAFDVWRRRWAKLQSAQTGVQVARCRLADVLREVAHNTRRAFLDAAREEQEHALAQKNAQQWQHSARVMAARLQAGDIAQTDLHKIELEAQRAHNAALGARKEWAQARAALAAHIGLSGTALLPEHLLLPGRPAPAPADKKTSTAMATSTDTDSDTDRRTDDTAARAQELFAAATKSRPDLLAAQYAVQQAQAQLVAQKREALPDITVGLAYGRSQFMISGDNPHTLGLSVSVPLPVADRNQVGRAQAHIAIARAHNSLGLLRIEVQHELTDALHALERAQLGIACFEGGGMLDKAERARAVAHRSLAQGAFSVLDVLEAERTALEVQAEHLAMEHALHQAQVDLTYVTAQEAL